MQAFKIFGVLLASSILQGNKALRGHSFLELEEKQLDNKNNNYARNGEKGEVKNGNKSVFVLIVTILQPIKKIYITIDIDYLNLLL